MHHLVLVGIAVVGGPVVSVERQGQDQTTTEYRLCSAMHDGRREDALV